MLCDARLESSGGSLLVPPLGGSGRMAQLGPLLPHDICLEGNTWKESSVDVAIAGAVTTMAFHSHVLLHAFCSIKWNYSCWLDM